MKKFQHPNPGVDIPVNPTRTVLIVALATIAALWFISGNAQALRQAFCAHCLKRGW